MNSIYATFADPSMAEKAGGALLDHGLRSEDLAIVFPEGYRPGSQSSSHPQDKAESGITTTTSGDAGHAAAEGAEIGLGVGILAGLAAIFVPGFGLVLGGSALAIAIGGAAGTTVAGAVAGGVTGLLKDQGVPEQAAQNYERHLAGGGALLTASPTDENIDYATIEGIITKYNGVVTTYPTADVTSRSSAELI